jgi:Tol biopolymer transport system component
MKKYFLFLCIIFLTLILFLQCTNSEIIDIKPEIQDGKLAYVSVNKNDLQHNYNLNILNFKTREVTEVKLHNYYQANGFNISPDGSKIALMAKENRSSNRQILIYNTSGRQINKVDCKYNCLFPKYSPDGKSLCFYATNTENGFAILTWNNKEGVKEIVSGERVLYPNWNPRDKNELIYISDNRQLVSINLRTKKEKVLHKSSSNTKLYYPSFYSDGKTILFVEGDDNIKTFNTETQQLKTLFKSQGTISSVCWVNEHIIAFGLAFKYKKYYKLQLLNINTGEKSEIAKTGRFTYGPSYSPVN